MQKNWIKYVQSEVESFFSEYYFHAKWIDDGIKSFIFFYSWDVYLWDELIKYLFVSCFTVDVC